MNDLNKCIEEAKKYAESVYGNKASKVGGVQTWLYEARHQGFIKGANFGIQLERERAELLAEVVQIYLDKTEICDGSSPIKEWDDLCLALSEFRKYRSGNE